MEGVYQTLADRALSRYKTLKASTSSEKPARLLIALAGPPGCGKTTIGARVATLLNRRLPKPELAVIVPIDGFHLPRSALDRLENKEEAYFRRGAPWTFDGEAAVALIQRCRHSSGILTAPSFDHAVKDPAPDGISISVEASIIIFDGLYLLSDIEPWNQIGRIVDEKWFVKVDPDLARRRVAARHVASGIEMTMELGLKRFDANDAINGQTIRDRCIGVYYVVESIEDPTITAQ